MFRLAAKAGSSGTASGSLVVPSDEQFATNVAASSRAPSDDRILNVLIQTSRHSPSQRAHG
jgi:hypothetical protein